ncbi:ExeA family protein [Oceanicoccus sp. KOV_DT_Chl]|uniref:ExeA family protein n=1 Tax=Oceanicoccus sp. KOV_DT_Chl TaxID=1904639 RepID=UPI000C7E431D|nr:ExeA family protein [Oceanicoccus sp. KOV_DT_Chl]
MYHRYFGLKEEPFSIAVNPRYLFMSARHRDALAHLLYGVGAGGGFILLTGEVGTGKTTVNRCLLEQLPDTTDIALILNPALNAVELLATACDEFQLQYTPGEQSLKILTDKLHQFLLSNHAKGRNTVLLIDEAQHLQFEVLEQIRLLTNLETNTKKLLQIILVGQPELRTLLNKPELRQLAQRITARYQLKPLNLEETEAYIRHRLQVAGLPANQILFPKKVVKGIHKVSRGVPRIINVLCDRMLLGTYGQNKTVVDNAMLKQSIVEVMGEEEDITLYSPRSVAPVLISLVIIVAGLLLWQWPTISSRDQPNTAVMQPVATESITDSITTEPAATAIETRAPSTQPAATWIDSEQQAINELLLTLGITDAIASCDIDLPGAIRCERQQVNTWQELIAFNRPAVISLITAEKLQAFAVVLAIKDSEATLVYQQTITTVPLSVLGPLWTGDFLFFWQTSEDYRSPFAKDYTGPMVRWLAEKFSELDQQPTLLAEQVFNEALSQRVKIFQQQYQLQADGVVGLKTLLKLNELLAVEPTLDDPNLIQTNSAPPTTVNAEEG